jgi:hypothetical protein
MTAFEKKRSHDGHDHNEGPKYEVTPALNEAEPVHDAVFGDIGDKGPNYRAVSRPAMIRHSGVQAPSGQPSKAKRWPRTPCMSLLTTVHRSASGELSSS